MYTSRHRTRIKIIYMNLDKYKCIIFDLDGTLINSMIAHAAAWEKTCTTFDIPYEKEWLNQLGGMPTRKVTIEIINRYNLELNADLITQDKISNFESIAFKGDTIPGIYQILKDNHLTKKIGIGTGAQRKHAQEILDTTDILTMVEVLVTSDEVVNHKPSPDTFLSVAQQLNTPANQCVVFEDTKIGKQAAIAAGMDCYLVNNGKILEFFPAI